jgi:hypothetical protein
MGRSCADAVAVAAPASLPRSSPSRCATRSRSTHCAAAVDAPSPAASTRPAAAVAQPGPARRPPGHRSSPRSPSPCPRRHQTMYCIAGGVVR